MGEGLRAASVRVAGSATQAIEKLGWETGIESEPEPIFNNTAVVRAMAASICRAFWRSNKKVIDKSYSVIV